MKTIFVKLNRYFRGDWRLAVLDEKSGRWTVAPEASNIAYLKAENADGGHILMQPLPKVQPYYMIADDISRDLLYAHHRHKDGSWKPGRTVVETSPENFQVWIRASRYLQLDEKRHWLGKMRSDPGADPNGRWGRCPGFRNRKAKYRDSEGGYPLSRLIWIDWKNAANVPAFSPVPRGGVCLKKSISRSEYDRGVRARAEAKGTDERRNLCADSRGKDELEKSCGRSKDGKLPSPHDL